MRAKPVVRHRCCGHVTVIRSALFVPANRPRAIEKARKLDADLLILDLEDAVPAADKATARTALTAALASSFGGSMVAVRINPPDGPAGRRDLDAIAELPLDYLVIPKVDNVAGLAMLPPGRPRLAMIESAAGVLEAAAIARAPGVAGLIAGTNDLAVSLRLPPGGARLGLGHALGAIVLAARAARGIALDGVCNRLDDAGELVRECQDGRTLGFDGKTLIHPDQIAPCHLAFAPSADELADARALVTAAGDGASRFRGRMVEAMHVAAARRLIAAARGGKIERSSL